MSAATTATADLKPTTQPPKSNAGPSGEETKKAEAVASDALQPQTAKPAAKKYTGCQKFGIAMGILSLLIVAGLITGASVRGFNTFFGQDIPNFFKGNIVIYI